MKHLLLVALVLVACGKEEPAPPPKPGPELKFVVDYQNAKVSCEVANESLVPVLKSKAETALALSLE